MDASNAWRKDADPESVSVDSSHYLRRRLTIYL
jgi:hypothetical protein